MADLMPVRTLQTSRQQLAQDSVITSSLQAMPVLEWAIDNWLDS